jgi:site-specific DNA-methyltransferase (adenine-specific)
MEFRKPAAADGADIDLIQGDARQVLRTERVADRSVHMVLTDPPYFLDGLGTKWEKGGKDTARATGSVGGLPVGMKFDPRQGRELQAFIEDVAQGWNRVLVPGGFALVFSQPRLAHRIAVGMEESGFEVRDQIVWHFTQRAQFKAFSQDHFVRRMKIPDAEKEAIIEALGGRKTPQLRPQFEAVIMAQKPREGTFVENWLKHRAGLMDATQTLNGKVPSNVMVWEKPAKDERTAANGHLTPKPLQLLEHMIELFTEPGQTVLDSFVGSGSTAVAARNRGRKCIGIELNPEYIEIARERLAEAVSSSADEPPALP